MKNNSTFILCCFEKDIISNKDKHLFILPISNWLLLGDIQEDNLVSWFQLG